MSMVAKRFRSRPIGPRLWSHLVHSVIEKKQEPTKKSSFDNNERRDVSFDGPDEVPKKPIKS
jgi:ribosomal protein S18 acetylase RimI-like enzyme